MPHSKRQARVANHLRQDAGGTMYETALDIGLSTIMLWAIASLLLKVARDR